MALSGLNYILLKHGAKSKYPCRGALKRFLRLDLRENY